MPSFQQLEISEITSEQVCTFCKELEKHGKKDRTRLSPKTISDILSVLRRILHYAQDQNISIDVTAFNIRVKQTPKVMEILSLSEQTTLQEYLMNQLDALNLGILICLYTQESELVSYVRWHGRKSLFLIRQSASVKRCSVYKSVLQKTKRHIS